MNLRNPMYSRIGADAARDRLAQDYAYLTAKLQAYAELIAKTRADLESQKKDPLKDPFYQSIVNTSNDMERRRRALKQQLDENPRPAPAPVTVIAEPTPDSWIARWQSLLINYGRLQPFKPQDPRNPGANLLVTGFMDEGTRAATIQFQKDFGYPADGVPKFEYEDVLNGVKPGPNSPGVTGTNPVRPGGTTANVPGGGAGTPAKSKPVQALTVAALLSPIALVWWWTR